ncbi:hypothetical protein DMUE_4216 [Dictyocoela muelleri]|nr:hypothetical protein DMUE_4216 [Dictyocoela muelleri]
MDEMEKNLKNFLTETEDNRKFYITTIHICFNNIKNNVEIKESLLTLVVLLSNTESAIHPTVKEKYVILIQFLSNKEYYDLTAEALHNACYEIFEIQDLFFDNHIFSYLDFNYKESTALLVNALCKFNIRNSEHFFKCYYDEERGDNQLKYIKELKTWYDNAY